ncbi:helix-turn-helix domain-containing protein [Leucobacter komagatae]|uniref:helix-turn-helix domain-containing protein n=1 Tax=Leucobacter komagatae TaxID=55969 RepID=UPI001FE84672|nr:helix-turn-helix transcriptional regulator [Leucobacter komagatae]
MQRTTDLERQQRKEFGARLRELRKERGLSQEGLAHEAELDRSYVGQVERGERNISLDNIYRFSRALGISPADLFTPGPR